MKVRLMIYREYFILNSEKLVIGVSVLLSVCGFGVQLKISLFCFRFLYRKLVEPPFSSQVQPLLYGLKVGHMDLVGSIAAAWCALGFRETEN